MPRVHRVKKARKDNPAVKKGEPYYWWKFRYAGKRYSKTHPRASQLTQSDKLSRYYEAQETVDDLNAEGDVAEIIDTLAEVSETVGEIGEEYQQSADNIRDYFEYSEVADQCEENVSACESTVESIDDAANALEGVESGKAVASIIGDISWEL